MLFQQKGSISARFRLQSCAQPGGTAADHYHVPQLRLLLQTPYSGVAIHFRSDWHAVALLCPSEILSIVQFPALGPIHRSVPAPVETIALICGHGRLVAVGQ